LLTANSAGIGYWQDPALAADAESYVRCSVGAAMTGLGLTIVSVILLPGWIGATLGVAQGLVWCAVMLWRRRSRWLLNLTLCGIVAGFVELAADAWLVHETKTLQYPPSGPFLFASPAYMPLAWFGMLSGGVAIGMALRKRWSLGASSFAAAFGFGLYVPCYEAFAAYAGWWNYQPVAPSFGPVPAFIIIGEILIGLPIVFLTEILARARILFAMVCGALLGVWIFVSYALAWAVLR
jgi:hypothetical protein